MYSVGSWEHCEYGYGEIGSRVEFILKCVQHKAIWTLIFVTHRSRTLVIKCEVILRVALKRLTITSFCCCLLRTTYNTSPENTLYKHHSSPIINGKRGRSPITIVPVHTGPFKWASHVSRHSLHFQCSLVGQTARETAWNEELTAPDHNRIVEWKHPNERSQRAPHPRFPWPLPTSINEKESNHLSFRRRQRGRTNGTSGHLRFVGNRIVCVSAPSEEWPARRNKGWASSWFHSTLTHFLPSGAILLA